MLKDHIPLFECAGVIKGKRLAFLSESERQTLERICDTLAPAFPDGDTALWRIGAADLDLTANLETALERVSDPLSLAQLKLLLTLFENSVYNGVGVGIWRSFESMTREQREAALFAWANSRIPQARMTFQSIKRLALALFYSLSPDGQPNPALASVQYAIPRFETPAYPPPIRPLEIHAPTTLTADVLVIGSGAGGGVIAGELSAAGADVIVVEKGDYFTERDFDGHELTANDRLFENSGALTTADRSMLVLAGKTLGGGTTINWSASLRTPDEVLDEWMRVYGFSGANTPAFARSLDAVMVRTNVNTTYAAGAAHNDRLEAGCRALGYHIAPIPRNVKGCEECGFCNFGCAFGAKQGTLKTYLQDAYDRGTRIIVRAEVERVTHSRGVVDGADVLVNHGEADAILVRIRAPIVVVAAGSLHTPAILMRSGLGNAHIGANLHLHPVTVTYGLYDEPIRGWQGAPMTRISGEFANLDGAGYGVRIETAPLHPGIGALALPWSNARQHREVMSKLAYLGNSIILARDRYGGRIGLDRRGQPVIHYRVHPHDSAHLMRGVLEALKIHRAADATAISSPHSIHTVWRVGEDFEAFLRDVEARGLPSNGYALFSAHQMSSARIGGSSAVGAVDPTGQTYEIRNLYAADGSVLPTASGVNPMITIMATAHYLAQGIKTKLG